MDAERWVLLVGGAVIGASCAGAAAFGITKAHYTSEAPTPATRTLTSTVAATPTTKRPALPPKVAETKPGPPYYPQGTYAVPAELPYGNYVAANAHPLLPGDQTYPRPSCSWTTFTGQGEIIDLMLGPDYTTVSIGPDVHAVQIIGCTPWVRIAPVN
ncbi:serine/threonine-protein kinase [Mycobacteroides abscessus subsp. abscessus]|nr:serine/threonine-protein kinase [Mycobacteroides abscessus subsp. abscessus]SIH86442.1 serine/threonine-protein kinase [Mycobacteroides abscessus subsp. abscessus]SII94428.1 serine/threonine-protein kinase [Mycobacteroides abscessus subsp. abscessus]SIJ26352.1 serine/threonine-protein kinase [Mycobacteroides abscessus subsp. abscessus]SIL37561.1 serine/threonine-protein kinase [Mycobacteroides abscessus subsp. abscessus]